MNFRNFLNMIVFCGTTILSSTVFSYETDKSSDGFNARINYPQRIYLDHAEGNWYDNSHGYTTVGVFSDLYSSDNENFVVFGDIRDHFFNDGKPAVNAGIGVRYQKDKCSPIYGINTYYDYRRTSWRTNCHQLGLGFEYLTINYDVRLNTYLPVGNSRSNSGTTVFNYEGGYRATVRDEKIAYGGADVEFGTWLKRKTNCNFFDLYGAIGSYYYAGRHSQRSDYGAIARIETRFLDYFTFEFRGGFSEVHHGMAQAILTYAVPLENVCNFFSDCCTNDIACERNYLIYQPVHRQEIIVLSKKLCAWTWNWDTPTIPCDCE